MRGTLRARVRIEQFDGEQFYARFRSLADHSEALRTIQLPEYQNHRFGPPEPDRFDDDLTWLRIFAFCGCRSFLREQLRKTRIWILGNGVGKGLQFNVLVVEPGLGSAQMILPESPKRRGYCGIYC